MFESFLSKLPGTQKQTGWRYCRTAAMGNTGKKNVCFSRIICSRCCTRRNYVNLRFFLRWKLSTRWSKTAPATIDLRSRHRSNPRPTRFVLGKAGECRWRLRRYLVNPWREGARGVLRSSTKPENRPTFCHRRGIENFCRLFSTHQRTKVSVSDAWPAPATYHRSFCDHCDQRVGRKSLTSAPRSDFMAQSLVLFIDVCRGLGIAPLRTNIWLSFSQADLGPRSAQELFFSGFWKVWNLFLEYLCS